MSEEFPNDTEDCNCHPYICDGMCVNECGCDHNADQAQVEWWLKNIARREALIYEKLAQDLELIGIEESQHLIKKRLFRLANQIREQL